MFLGIVGVIIFFVGLVALIKGGMPSIKIKTRGIAALVLVAGFVVFIVGIAISAGNDVVPVAGDGVEEVEEIGEESGAPEEEAKPETKPETKPEPESQPASETAPQPEPTLGEKNAARKALDYLNYTSFSYSGLVEQLKFEGYSHEEAVYGVDNCGADWNEQAALKAQEYLDYSSFSRDGLIAQLEFEGFTRQQAEYGVQAVGY